MDLESECSLVESVEDNEEIKNVSVLDKFEDNGEPKVHNYGSYVVEHNDSNELKWKENSPNVKVDPEYSPSLPTTRKGRGLKKWRRIKRDFSKGEDSSINIGKVVTPEMSDSVVSASKRVQVYIERNPKSESSASSTNAVVRNFLDGFALHDDYGLGNGPSFVAGMDSESSEDQSSKSSTAASAPKLKYDGPVVVGFPHDKSMMRTLSGKNASLSVHSGQQGNGQVENTKNARGDRVKIEQENSHSSVESDLRSFNFLLMQGTYSTSNGIQCERPIDYNGQNGDEVQGSEAQVSDGLGGCARDAGGYEEISPEAVVSESAWEVKEGRSDNRGSSTAQDPVAESIFALQSAQEALEKEVLKFKEITRDVLIDDSVSGLPPKSTDVQQKSQECRDVEAELEVLFTRKIEAEVEYLALSRSVQNLSVATVNQITVLEEQKALASEQTQILNKLEETQNKAVLLKKEAEKLENMCEDIANADETLKLQKRVFKYTSCFFMQLVLLVVILGVFIFQLSPNYVEVVPT